MSSEPQGATLPDSVFCILRDLIHDRTGVHFADDRRQVLEDKLSSRITALGLDSFLDYFYLLRYGADSVGEWRLVQDAIAVPETYLWREMDQVWALRKRLIPALIAESAGRPIYIWSAACSSGEEPLSIAMALDEAGWFAKADIRIVASDASSGAIGRARDGRFSERSCRHLPAAIRERYFTAAGRDWKIDSVIHSRVSWHVANLYDSKEIAPFLIASVVFCRNVFIYFSSDAIQATVGTFSRALPRPAYLFLGVAESLVSQRSDFVLEEVDNAFVYKRD